MARYSYYAYDEIVACRRSVFPAEPLDRRAPSIHPYTSGSTAKPKGNPASRPWLTYLRLGDPQTRYVFESNLDPRVPTFYGARRRRLVHTATPTLVYVYGPLASGANVGDVGG